MDCSTSGFAALQQLQELAETDVHRVAYAIQPFHLLSSPSPPAFNLSQHQGLVVCGLIVMASLVAEHRLQGTQASAVVVHGLSCPETCGILPGQGSNPRPLHWQVDS